jgi:hypothetical protein
MQSYENVMLNDKVPLIFWAMVSEQGTVPWKSLLLHPFVAANLFLL